MPVDPKVIALLQKLLKGKGTQIPKGIPSPNEEALQAPRPTPIGALMGLLLREPKDWMLGKNYGIETGEKIVQDFDPTGLSKVLQQIEKSLGKATAKEASKETEPAIEQEAPKLLQAASKRVTPTRAPAAVEAAARLSKRTGLPAPNQATEDEIEKFRALYDQAFKLKDPSAQKDIESVLSELVRRKQPQSPQDLKILANKRNIIEGKLSNLMRALAELQQQKQGK